MQTDTPPEVRRRQLELLQRMSPGERLQQAFNLTRLTRELAFAGLRQRYPEATEQELLRRYAELVLGKELAKKVYGAMPGEGA